MSSFVFDKLTELWFLFVQKVHKRRFNKQVPFTSMWYLRVNLFLMMSIRVTWSSTIRVYWERERERDLKAIASGTCYLISNKSRDFRRVLKNSYNKKYLTWNRDFQSNKRAVRRVEVWRSSHITDIDRYLCCKIADLPDDKNLRYFRLTFKVLC